MLQSLKGKGAFAFAGDFYISRGDVPYPLSIPPILARSLAVSLSLLSLSVSPSLSQYLNSAYDRSTLVGPTERYQRQAPAVHSSCHLQPFVHSGSVTQGFVFCLIGNAESGGGVSWYDGRPKPSNHAVQATLSVD